jgi:CheY-like chemotaxis protein
MPPHGQILIVESDPSVQAVVAAIVRHNQLEPVIAADGTSALMWLSAEEFDVIVLDLLLPRLNGMDVLRHIAGSMPLLLERIIVVTAAPESFYRDCPMVADTRRVLSKPVELDVLEEELLECYAERVRDEQRKPPRSAARLSAGHIKRVAN